ncbi:ltaE [Lepeophtheirus salmonis]|uniref:LtaE n=1 Tax=Lepeophtheirus salmonis TaxID=72036 RepID=A0A7R8HDS7_LEPSM|nr:ltaE [Lepeophtheirus salmonis]CAF3016861.1 ltaE [Lepeophtheirus salmonis]
MMLRNSQVSSSTHVFLNKKVTRKYRTCINNTSSKCRLSNSASLLSYGSNHQNSATSSTSMTSILGAKKKGRGSILNVDLRSDTQTVPCKAMRKSLSEALVGDDVYGEDPTAIKLKKNGCGDCWNGGWAFCSIWNDGELNKYHVFGGVHSRTLPNAPDGTFDLQLAESLIRCDDIHYPVSKVLVIENTHNKCGGKSLPLAWIQGAYEMCRKNDLILHCDAARIFNAGMSSGVPVKELLSPWCDSACICLSKSLGAPIGSVVVGKVEFIKRARRLRKALGGGMRQAGIIAQAAIFAIENNVEKLKEDHERCSNLAQAITEDLVQRLLEIPEKETYDLEGKGARVYTLEFAKKTVRIVFHLSITNEEYLHGLKKIMYETTVLPTIANAVQVFALGLIPVLWIWIGCPACVNVRSGLHHIPGLPQTYVRVLFDFEYIDQEKKRVLMRENEVLLLLSKTNVDWWQVIRRGERRPFYAPAKYVLEMRTDPPPVVDTRYYKPCTTFGFPHKRSSYAPPSGSTVPPPAALDARFHPRYRSNSLDSILVSDQTKAMITLRDIPTRPPYLEKRPTIEALDKRKSWNILDAPPPRLQGRLAAYQNHTPFLLHRQTSKAKKPVPLPRASNKSVAEPPPKALGKRSKTDLTLDGLKAYKANRNSSKLVIPKLPVEERDPFKVPEKPLLSTFGVKRKSAEEPLSRVLSERKENQEKFVKSEPLIIMTQPLNDSTPGTKLASSLESSGGEDLTKSSSFDSCFDDTSLDDSAMLSLITICDEKSSRLYIDDTASSLSPDMKSPVSTTSRSPPSPSPNMTPTRNLMKSWKPPRKSKGWSEGYSAPNSPDPESDKVKRKLDLNDVISAHFLGDDCDEVDQNISNHERKRFLRPRLLRPKKDEEPPIPDGYERHKEEDNNFYINIFTGVRWYSAKDLNGKVYFYEEKWKRILLDSTKFQRVKQEEHQRRHEDTNKCFVSSPNFQIGCVSIVVLKQGPLNKTKIFRKWEEAKKELVGSSGSGKPEHVVDLKGTLIEWCKGDKSKRSYVFEVTSALFGLSVLLQGDSLNVSADWELKEPLIPWECVDALLQVPTQPSHPHSLFFLKHLTRVTEFKESNRMQIHNLAIVFGPTLMWPPPHLGASNNLALDMMQQNIIVETLLSHVNNLGITVPSNTLLSPSIGVFSLKT